MAAKMLKSTKNIMIVGVGGQGTLLTSRILGRLILRKGYDVKLSEVHGMAQRGGSVVTFVRYGDRVEEPIVEAGQADLLIAFECLEGMRYAHFLRSTGKLVINEQRIDPMPVIIGYVEYPKDIIGKLKEANYIVYSIDAESEAKELGNSKVSNMIVLGRAARYLDFKFSDWMEVIEETVPKKTIEVNKKAFCIGYQNQ
ncbi:MAG: indolepyruvate oxidoreductase subunit beta [Lachnoclostridium sp.]|nr:indolepyruvate oxidoreductase subunit beta [Lachnoclostridium sp.]